MKSFLLAVGCVSAITWASASCGGDSTGGGGGATQADAASVCSDACSKVAALGCGSSNDCATQCTFSLSHAGACADQALAYAQCLTDNVTDCSGSAPACSDAKAAVMACSGGEDCLSTSVDVSNGGCSASAGCSTGLAEVSCDSSAHGTTCTCSLGGHVAGTCSPAPGSDGCDLQQGCCAQFY